MLSVTCPKCSARYSMSEDLYQRKGGGEAVVVTCRKCKSEIRFEAPDEKTKPSNETPMPESVKAVPAENPADENGPFVALSSGFFGNETKTGEGIGPLPEVAEKPAEEAAQPTTQAAALSAEEAKPASETPQSAAEAIEAVKTTEESVPVSERPIDSTEAVPAEEVMSIRGDELETATVPLVMNKASNGGSNGASANPFEPGTNPKLKKPLPPPRKKEAEKAPEPDHEESGPPSGTPSLTALMGGSVRPKAKNRVDEDFFAGISGPQAVSLAPPTIDVSSFSAPASADSAPDSAPPPSSERAPDSIPVSTAHPHKKKKKKKHGRTTSHAPGPSKTSAGATTKPVTKSAP
ncbi:MAG TPA: hypothetical protein VM686_35525, partial [Polyangiaceae bacterium]|nr:hypothetical protein [Polyangiaceae bacterium]